MKLVGSRKASRDVYAARINRVLDYVRANPDLDLSLSALAKVAHLSDFHFHRIFRHYAGETLNAYVRRARTEAVAARMRANPQMSMTRIALEAGFSSAADFSRTFRQLFGIAPREWDRLAPLVPVNAADPLAPHAPDTAELRRIAESGAFAVTLKEAPRRRIAYVRVTNPYGNAQAIMAAYERLMTYARERVDAAFEWKLLGMSQDDPDITPLDKCRYDICITVPEGIDGQDVVSIRELSAGRYACTTAVGGLDVVAQAWQQLFHWWLPRSKWQPSNSPAIEWFRKTPDEIGWGNFNVECAVPVEPL